GSIGESLQQVPNTLFSEPDITYQVKGFGDFSMIPADHFKPSNLSPLLLQLPKKVVPFAQWLIGQKNWIIKTLSECYLRIGKAQASFLLDLIPQNLTLLPITRLRDEFASPYHLSTYCRLLQNRSVKIMALTCTRWFPLAFLLPTKEEIAKYHWVPIFNGAMKDELESKTAISDEDLSTMIRGVTRRTIAKHRQSANIPPHWVRQEAYNKGKDTPYRIPFEIELFLQEDLSIDVPPTSRD